MSSRWSATWGLLVALAAVSPARAQDGLSGFDVDLEPGLTTMSVVVSLQGDADGDAEAAVRYRVGTGGSWTDAHRGVRIAGGRLASALFGLPEAAMVEVEVTCTDPDGGAASGTAVTATTTTRAAPVLTAPTRTWVVDPAGDDGGAGDAGDPFATIAHAVSVAGAGEEILVRDGVYREAVEIDGFDGSSAPLWIHAENPLGAVLDGSDAAIWDDAGGDLWADAGDGVFTTAVAAEVGYVASDDAQLYHYESLADLLAESEGVHEGYWWDAGTLHVRLHGDDDPDGHRMAVGVLDNAFGVWNSSGVIIEGFEIRYYGSSAYPKGVYLRSSSDCVVRDCEIHHVVTPVNIRPTDAHRNLVERCHIWDTGIADWPWDAVKGSFHEASGVSLCGGEGNVVRNNVIHDIFNGVYVGSFDNDWDESEAPFSDVHNNLLYDIPDDPLEPEGAVHQVKMFLNRIEESLQGISTAPVNVGPLWFHHNDVWRARSSGIKLNNTPVGPMLIYHNTFATDAADTNAITTGCSGWSNVTLRNNIIVGTRYVIEDCYNPGSGNDWDNDLLYTTATDRFVKWANERYDTLAELRDGTGQEMAGLEGDPLLADPGGGDLTLTAGSPAVDAGQPLPGINDGYDGAAPDLGATELGGTPPGPAEDVPGDDDDDDDAADDDAADDDAADDDAVDDDAADGDDDDGGGCSCRHETAGGLDTAGAAALLLLASLGLGAMRWGRRR